MPKNTPKSRKDIFKFMLLLIIVMTAIGLSYQFDIYNKFSVAEIRKTIISMGPWGPLIYMISYAFTSIIFFPASLLSTASGAIWGTTLGTIYTVIGATISAVLPFLISRYLGRRVAERMMKNAKIDICDKFMSNNGFVSVLILRLVPLFPWDAVNYGSGLCGIRFRDYIPATFLGIIPGSFMYNLIGASLGEPFEWSKVIIIFSIVIVFSTVTIIARNKIGNKSY